MPKFLHVGCGLKRKDQTTAGFNKPEWEEIRLDIAEKVEPDILCSMTEMTPVADGSVDAVFSSHNLEHLYWHEVSVALGEFQRVLKPDGILVLTCPDLQSICARVAEDKLLETAYESPAGPIAAIDMLYGLRPSLAKGAFFMAHKSGFTEGALKSQLLAAGFQSWATMRRQAVYDLWAVGSKARRPDDEMMALAYEHFPVRRPA